VSEEGKLDPNGWMLTFADLVMLLLTFFVMLLTMSSMDAKKLRNIMTHFRASTGVLDFAGSSKVYNLGNFINQYNDTDSLLVVDQKHFLAKIKFVTNIKKKLTDINNQITLSEDERGVALVYPVLNIIADAIKTCPNNILIMGQTDNIPVRSKIYPSNWELSAYRGLSVLDYFINQKGLSPSRFSVGGYGSSRPLYPNITPKNRALNRRVEIIFKHLKET
jgi:chemotaxis protein MotB